METHRGGAKKDIPRKTHEADPDGQRGARDAADAEAGVGIVSMHVCISRMC